MFDDKTYANLMKDALAEVPDTLDKRQGSIIYDAMAPSLLQLSYAYIAFANALDLVSLPTAKGEYLDAWGWTFGITRNPAKSAIYEANLTVRPPTTPLDLAGSRFFDNESGFYFVLVENADNALVFEAESTGVQTNVVQPGTEAVPLDTIRALESASFGTLLEPGTNTESDDAYRERIHEASAKPAANGNMQHYKTWCESVPGVGRAKIVPRFAGNNTVLGVLFGTEGEPATPAIVEQVQEYIDPITHGYTVEYEGQTLPIGDGDGSGVANIGAHFAAVSARRMDVSVDINVLLADGYNLESASREIKKILAAYFRRIALAETNNKASVIRLSNVGAAILSLPAVIDYNHLLLNGQARNIIIGNTEAAILTEVIVTSENISR